MINKNFIAANTPLKPKTKHLCECSGGGNYALEMVGDCLTLLKDGEPVPLENFIVQSMDTDRIVVMEMLGCLKIIRYGMGPGDDPLPGGFYPLCAFINGTYVACYDYFYIGD